MVVKARMAEGELVPSVFTRKTTAIDALTKDNSGFSQVIDYRLKQVALHDASSVTGTRQITEYRLTSKCFEFLVARKCRAVFNITEQPAQPAFDPVPAAANA